MNQSQQSKPSQVVKLSANENPFGPSPKALAAMRSALPTLGLYPPDETALKGALADLHGLDASHVVTANGGCDVLKLAALSYLQEDASVVVSNPAFPVYALTAGQAGAQIIDAPLEPETFAFCPEAIRAALTPNTKVVYLCNPNNPTGTTFGQDTFDALLDAIPEDVLIVYDEVYYHFATDVVLPDAKAAVKAGRNLLIIHSFSKAYGLAGLRVGYGLATPDIVGRLESQKNPVASSTLALIAAEAALTDTEHVQRTVENNNAERALLAAALQDMGLKVWPSQTNFVLFEVPNTHTPQNVADALQAHGVMVRLAFGLDNHLRVSVGLPDGNAKFLAALKSSLD